MKDDFLSCLTQEIRDEAIERYLTERRLLELQIEDLQPQVVKVRAYATEVSRRLMRLAFWMIGGDLRECLLRILSIPEDSPWRKYLEGGSAYELHSVQASALRDRVKLRKILIRSYDRAYSWSQRYGKEYIELEAQCAAVNANIQRFQNNAELLTVLSFVKGLDVCGVEKSHFLGGNFTAAELTSVDERLRFHLVSIQNFGVAPPLVLPDLDRAAHPLGDLADRIYEHYCNEVKRLLQAMGRYGY